MFLPRPYPDELVGSLLHRAERQLGIGREQLLLRLTGHPLSSHSFLITPYTGIAHAFGSSLSGFLGEHTVLPYMTAFMRPDEKAYAQARLLDAQDQLSRTASLIRRSVSGQTWLRFCPRCLADELARFGDSYWHRAHQLSGVEVCVQHSTDLFVTSLKIARDAGVPPPHEVTHFHVVHAQGIPRTVSQAIAQRSAEALWHANDGGHLAQDYQRRAWSLGYRYIRGQVHGALLSHDLKRFFGEDFLLQHGCPMGTGRKGLWPSRLLHESPHATTFKHILLNVFLDSLPTPSASRVDFEGRHNPKPRDWHKLEQDAIACLTHEVAQHKAAGTRVNLEDLYDLTHIRSLVRNNRCQLPLLMAWIENFKKSPQSSRVPGKRPRR